jgi:hypothetical protein
MQRLEVSCAVRPIYGSLGTKGLIFYNSVSQTVVLRFCPCGPLGLKISPNKTEKIKLT